MADRRSIFDTPAGIDEIHGRIQELKRDHAKARCYGCSAEIPRPPEGAELLCLDCKAGHTGATMVTLGAVRHALEGEWIERATSTPGWIEEDDGA